MWTKSVSNQNLNSVYQVALANAAAPVKCGYLNWDKLKLKNSIFSNDPLPHVASDYCTEEHTYRILTEGLLNSPA